MNPLIVAIDHSGGLFGSFLHTGVCSGYPSSGNIFHSYCLHSACYITVDTHGLLVLHWEMGVAYTLQALALLKQKEMLNIYLGGIGEYIPVCRKEPNNAPESPMETTLLFAFASIMKLLILATKVSKFYKC